MVTVVFVIKPVQSGIYKEKVSVANVPYDPIHKGLQSLNFVLCLSRIVLNCDRFRQSGKSCSAVSWEQTIRDAKHRHETSTHLATCQAQHQDDGTTLYP